MTEKIKMLMQSFQFNQQWIIFADTKAVAVLTINGILMGFILPLGKTLRELSGYTFGIMTTLFVCYLLTAFLCCFLSIVTIYPRPHKRGNVSALFNIATVQKDYPLAEDSERYAKKFMETDADELAKDYAELLHLEYLVSARKYSYVKKSIFSFFTSIVIAVILLTINSLVL